MDKPDAARHKERLSAVEQNLAARAEAPCAVHSDVRRYGVDPDGDATETTGLQVL
jgi:hypothetical protein